MRTISAGLKPAIDWPSNRIFPLRGGVTPEIVFIRVVLPAPLDPMTATISPLVHLQRHVRERLALPVVRVDLLSASIAHAPSSPR